MKTKAEEVQINALMLNRVEKRSGNLNRIKVGGCCHRGEIKCLQSSMRAREEEVRVAA